MRNLGAAFLSGVDRINVALEVNAPARAAASLTAPAANGDASPAGTIQSNTTLRWASRFAPCAAQQVSQSADMKRSIKRKGGGTLHAGAGSGAAVAEPTPTNGKASAMCLATRIKNKATPKMHS
jgi:hypothetical protein